MRTGRIFCQPEVVDAWIECPYAEPAWLSVGILHRLSNLTTLGFSASEVPEEAQVNGSVRDV
jgi:hypothetical protein